MKRRLTAAALGLAVGALGVAGTSIAGSTHRAATTYLFKASLDTRQQVPSPTGASGATGVLTATVTLLGKRGSFAWKLSFKHLSGRAVAAHVYLGTPGKTGSIIIPLCGPCTVGAHGEYFGPIGANTPLLKTLLRGGTYVNVQTKKNPSGEIRGQLKLAS